MIDSLYIGATGMNAQQLNIDTVANNLANVNTPGFKRSRVDFEDLVYRAAISTSVITGETSPSLIGTGTAVAGMAKIFSGGDVKKTGEPLDLAINGQGFFEILMPDGSMAYTRNGAFRLDAEGFVATQDGYRLSAQLQVPPDAQQVRIERDGRAFARLPGDAAETEIGHLDMANFPNPAGLTAHGDNLYTSSEQSGPASIGPPTEAGIGSIEQGFLESSNVRLIDEMINLILAQRAYEINAKVVQASDELLGISNNLHR